VERRSLPGETPERVEAQVRALLDGLQTLDPTFQATVKTILARDPFAVAADEPIVQLVRRHATAISGREPALTGVPFWTDAALFASAGIPALLFGPHGAGAHAAVEWVDLTTVEQCAEIYLNIAAEFCGEST
jgi:acetylornithine deacetylase